MSCNKPTEYSSSPPKFCSNCGKNYFEFASASPSPSRPKDKPQPLVKNEPKHVDDDDDNDGQGSDNTNTTPIDIQKLSYDVIADLQPPRESLGSIGRQPKTGYKRPPVRGKKTSKKDFEKEWGKRFDTGTRKSPINLGE